MKNELQNHKELLMHPPENFARTLKYLYIKLIRELVRNSSLLEVYPSEYIIAFFFFPFHFKMYILLRKQTIGIYWHHI